MSGQLLTIRLKAFDHQRVDAAARAFVSLAQASGTTLIGPRPLPVKLAWYRAEAPARVGALPVEPKKLPVHQRLLALRAPSAETVLALEQLGLPAGVSVQITSG